MRKGGCLTALGLGLALAGLADDAFADDTGNLSDLEQVTVYAPRASGSGTAAEVISLGGTAVTHADMQQFNRDTLDKAFVLASGTSVSLTGARNETDVWFCAFDRWRVPLY